MTGILAVKLARDLREAWPRLVMMVAAIAVSLLVLGSVLYAWSVMGRETEEAYLATAPASATIVLAEPVDVDRMRAIAAQATTRPGMLAAAGRTQFTADLAVNGAPRDLRIQAFVAAPDDPMRLARFDVSPGAWTPAAGEVLIRRDSLELLGVAVGDEVTLTAPGGPVSLRVAGTVYDPSLAPAPQHQQGNGYLSTAALAGPVGLDQLKLQVAGAGGTQPSRDRDAIVAVAGEVGEWLRQEHGLTIREIQVPEPYAHPHQAQADALLLAILAGGAAALLLSAILVANMLNGIFTQQIPQIGIMKAVGGRSGHIGRMYVVMTLLVAAAATLIAVPPAIVIGRWGVAAVLDLLGVQPASLAAPGWAYAAILAAGLGLAPAMALVPLVRASSTTVRAAIDHRGLGGGTPVATGLLRRLGAWPRANRSLLMALRNTLRRPARLLLAVGLLASAGAVFVAGMSLSSGVAAVAAEQQQARTWDVDAQLATPAPMDAVRAALAPVPGITDVQGWHRARGGVAGPGRIPLTRTYPDQGHGGVSVVAVPAGAARPPGRLLQGRWLRPGETGAVVLNQVARTTTVPGIGAGDAVQLYVDGRATTWRVVGVLEQREGGAGTVYTTDAGYAAATGQPVRVNTLRITGDRHDEPSRQAVADLAAAALAGAGLEVASAASVSHADAVTGGHLDPIILIVLSIAVAMAVVGGIGLASTMSANVLDRIREFGVLHAIGARPRTVRRIVVAEGVFLALLSFIAAVVPALVLTRALGAGLGSLFLQAPLPYRISGVAVAIWLALALLGTVLATDAAATRASRMTVREALAYL